VLVLAVGSGRLVGGGQHAGGGRHAVDESEHGQWAAVGEDGIPIPAPGPPPGRPDACMISSSVGLVDTTTLLMFLLPGSAGTVPAAHPRSAWLVTRSPVEVVVAWRRTCAMTTRPADPGA
jgi:hypothetical protein